MAKLTKVIDGLNNLVADATVFAYKLHNYHWNVRGPGFFTLHAQFETLYTQWAVVMDALAERVLSLGGTPIGTLAEVLKRSAIAEEVGNPDAPAMVASIVNDLHVHRDRMKKVSELAQEFKDKTTENILDEFIDASAKHVWMLSAYLGKTAVED